MKKIIIKFDEKDINVKSKNVNDSEVIHIASIIVAKIAKENNICKKHFQEIMGKYYEDAE